MILGHTLGLFTHPDQEWLSIREERATTGRLYAQHTLLLALIPSIAAYIGSTQVGWTIGSEETVKLTQISAFNLCALFYVSMLSGIYILGKFIDFMAITYGVDKNAPRGIELAAYAATPLFIMGAIAVYPNIWVNMFAGLVGVSYSVYLLYEGLPILMKIPKERGFMFATSVLTVGLVMLVALIATSVVIWSVGIGPVYTN
ncbi:Amino acid transporters [Hahella chejuensis KCTC 2396]|uniref:Amino acid transporters n=1 Tax=Hahella chejuensis (strain KCTC 2396) TaxID=349521 RepID=Q2SL62_HAHCH|nr:Yip1 family protein [Hahella chejuensis]ABC28612.1 Amino acid transporters [Hahella chejuensis KCTC 2396]